MFFQAMSSGTWFPGGPAAKPSPLQSLSSPKTYAPHTSAFSSVSGAKPHNSLPLTAAPMDRKLDEKVLTCLACPVHGHKNVHIFLYIFAGAVAFKNNCNLLQPLCTEGDRQY